MFAFVRYCCIFRIGMFVITKVLAKCKQPGATCIELPSKLLQLKQVLNILREICVFIVANFAKTTFTYFAICAKIYRAFYISDVRSGPFVPSGLSVTITGGKPLSFILFIEEETKSEMNCFSFARIKENFHLTQRAF